MAAHDDPLDTSPIASTAPASTSSSTTGPVPLDSPLRTTPIHPSIPLIKVPSTAASTEPNTNPITLQPFTEAELAKHGYEKLRAHISAAAGNSNPRSNANGGVLSEKEKEELQRIKEETAMLLKHKLDEREQRVREIEREMEEKEKIREVERKVFRKKLGSSKDV